MRKGAATRERILEIAEAAVLSKGFGATSIEELIAAAGLTKSGFFYHFRDKNALALGLLARNAAQNQALIGVTFERARALSDDPLQRLLIGLALLAEAMDNLPGGHPGCIVASLSYQDRLFDRAVRTELERSAAMWICYFEGLIGEIADVYPLPAGLAAERLARSICSTIDGAIVMAKELGRPEVLAEQVLMIRYYVQAVFGAAPGRARQPPRAVA